jgi:hypothetical protein
MQDSLHMVSDLKSTWLRIATDALSDMADHYGDAEVTFVSTSS